MPDGFGHHSSSSPSRQAFRLGNLRVNEADNLGVTVREILFRSAHYAIYRSDRGVYVQCSDDETREQEQHQAYTLLCGQLCELRYLTAQMGTRVLNKIPMLKRIVRRRGSLYEHNMAQALMLLMESAAQRAAKHDDLAATTEARAKEIADRALDMAVRRVTVDNTIRYVRTCVVFGVSLISGLLLFRHFTPLSAEAQSYLFACAMGAVGAVFSVIVRAEAFELKPCDDSRLNKLVGAIRVGMGGIAGPVLLLLITTVFASSAKTLLGDTLSSTGSGSDMLRMVATLGLIGGFAERLVPNLVRNAAEQAEFRAGTPVQAAKG